MSILHETVTAYLPSKKKTTPSGWTSFNAPCCIHNGDSADKRQRGGLISNADGGISYHCFPADSNKRVKSVHIKRYLVV